MLTSYFWVPASTGVVSLLLALLMWVRGQRRRSLACRWFSLVYVTVALGMGFAAVPYLATPRTFDPWLDLEFAALFLAVCALVVALVYRVRENRRGSAMPR